MKDFLIRFNKNRDEYQKLVEEFEKGYKAVFDNFINDDYFKNEYLYFDSFDNIFSIEERLEDGIFIVHTDLNIPDGYDDYIHEGEDIYFNLPIDFFENYDKYLQDKDKQLEESKEQERKNKINLLKNKIEKNTQELYELTENVYCGDIKTLLEDI